MVSQIMPSSIGARMTSSMRWPRARSGAGPALGDPVVVGGDLGFGEVTTVCTTSSTPTARPTRIAVMMASSIADAPRSPCPCAARSRASCLASSSREYSTCRCPGKCPHRSPPGPFVSVRALVSGVSSRASPAPPGNQKDQEAPQSSIWATSIDWDRSPASPSMSASSRRRMARRPGGQRLADLGAVVGDQAERGGQVAQLIDGDLLAELAERLPRGDAGDPGVA